MPEGPEVRVMRDWLQSHLALPRRLDHINILSGRYHRYPGTFTPDAAIPSTVVSVKVHGKFLWLELEGLNLCVCFTMGMSGNFSEHCQKHSRLVFDFDQRGFYFNDARNFGTCRLMTLEDVAVRNALSRDPLQAPLAQEELLAIILKRKDLTLAELLMAQREIVGIGNYLKAEILWQSRLSPHRLAGSLNMEEVVRLLISLNEVPRVSYENRGASIRTYITPDQKRGAFADLFKVYRRKTDAEGNTVVRETTKDGRTTHWAPARQS